jgi:hypothetical protein
MTVFHPATVQLLRLQSRGRLRRMWGRFCQPRRLVLSAVACVLAVVWLGNAAMTIWLRETASPTTLRALLSLGLVLYATWHFAKAAFFRPESPFDWTPAQRDMLAAMPFRPRDLIAYQLASVTVTTLLKALIFTLLLLPDLRCVPLGLVGVLLAMLTLEILRMAIEISTWGFGRSAFLAYRAVVVAALVAGGSAVGAILLRADVFGGRVNVGEGLSPRFLEVLVRLNASALGYAALPFRPFIELILAKEITATSVWLCIATLGTVTALAAVVVALYAETTRRVAARERHNYTTSMASRDFSAWSARNRPGPTQGNELRVRSWGIPRLGGAGTLAWRQLVGARRHWGSLLTAMIAPFVISCAPCFMIATPDIAFLATAGTLAFYTFLLLPTALRFDFRRDLDRFATLKGLPITPAATVIGQTLSPVLIATLFQIGVLGFAVAARSLPPHHLLLSIVVMIPLNVLVFGIDNLIFLLYPYRIQQEGLEIFLRTILTFTGKGLLFAVGFAATSAWGAAATALACGLSPWMGSTVSAPGIFLGGMIAGPSLFAALVLCGLCRAYRNMDPIEDLPR